MIEQSKSTPGEPSKASIVGLTVLGGLLAACAFWIAWAPEVTARGVVGSILVMVFAAEVIYQGAHRAQMRQEQMHRRRFEREYRAEHSPGIWIDSSNEDIRMIRRDGIDVYRDIPSAYDVWGR